MASKFSRCFDAEIDELLPDQRATAREVLDMIRDGRAREALPIADRLTRDWEKDHAALCVATRLDSMARVTVAIGADERDEEDA